MRSQLTQMTVGSDTLYFTYGAMGPATVTWDGYTYYYVLNGQGDVTAILDEDGIPVVWYNWNTAWGYNPRPEGLFADTLGELNPLRYRSYVYDTETGYYYLQSRYYDPKIGRFINADALVATGQGMLGNNMFAYCNNNPVNLLDPAGTYCCAIFGDDQLLHLNMRVYFGGGGGSHASGGVSTRGHSITMKEYLDTSDPEVAYDNLEKHGMAYYNGVPIIELPFLDKNAFSFGIIFMGDEVDSRGDSLNTLRHEYGHAVHFEQIGIVSYTVFVAMPSMIGFWTDVPTEKYYSQPYEYIADILGGVDRTYHGEPYPYSISPTAAAVYWTITLVMP